MSKRAEQRAMAVYPTSTPPSYLDGHDLLRQEAFIKGYELAEKDTIKRVIDWVRKNAYIYTDTQNDEEGNLMTVFLEKAFIDDLKKAMEENNG